jgi:hypothetical protein
MCFYFNFKDFAVFTYRVFVRGALRRFNKSSQCNQTYNQGSRPQQPSQPHLTSSSQSHSQQPHPNTLTIRRFFYLLFFYLVFLIIEFMNWLGFCLDEILFPQYKHLQVEAPVFIIGNPRSGTTFLQRLMAQDTNNFTCTKTWEIFLAPSITQRTLFHALARFDRWLGQFIPSPLRFVFNKLASWVKDINHERHQTRLRAHEEDLFFLVHIWSSLVIWHVAGILDYGRKYAYFDQRIPQDQQDKIMQFYYRCLQKHLYYWQRKTGQTKTYLAKNPLANGKIQALKRYFPQARFIYLQRDPVKVVSSLSSFMVKCWVQAGSPSLKRHKSAQTELSAETDLSKGQEVQKNQEESTRSYSYWPLINSYVLELVSTWTDYALQQLKALGQQSKVVQFSQLVQQVEATVQDIYDQFGWELSADFSQVVRQRALESANYSSKHEYDLEQMVFSPKQVRERLA